MNGSLMARRRGFTLRLPVSLNVRGRLNSGFEPEGREIRDLRLWRRIWHDRRGRSSASLRRCCHASLRRGRNRVGTRLKTKALPHRAGKYRPARVGNCSRPPRHIPENRLALSNRVRGRLESPDGKRHVAGHYPGFREQGKVRHILILHQLGRHDFPLVRRACVIRTVSPHGHPFNRRERIAPLLKNIRKSELSAKPRPGQNRERPLDRGQIGRQSRRCGDKAGKGRWKGRKGHDDLRKNSAVPSS